MTPEIWREDSQLAFEKGEAEGVSLTREGTVTLAPDLVRVADTGEGFVWALASDGKGTLYIATGPEGRIFSLKTGETAPKLLFDSPEVAIFSLAVGADGALYAGSSPGGLIYRLVPGQEPKTFCRTGDAHVWALLPRSDGGLYAATGGDQGRVLKISAAGEATALYTAKDPNVVSLVAAPGGLLYAGTDRSGLIYRIENETQASVLYDAGEKEIHALAIGANGDIYAAAMARDPKSDNGDADNGNKKKTRGGSVLYAIRPSGSAQRLWEADDPLLLGLAVQADGSLMTLTGKEGRLYRVWLDGTATMTARLKDVRPWVMLPEPKGDFWIGTSGAGLVYRLGQNLVHKGTLTSEPHDFSLVAHWGRVSWKGEQVAGTAVSVQTRSGNSETPDDTWSDWSAPVTASDVQIASRPARFLQYRLQLTSEAGKATPQVREIRLAGLQENMPPLVLGVQAERIGRDNKDDKGGEAPPGLWKLDWTAGDVNDDPLVYAVYFRGVGDPTWKLLKDKLTVPHFLWDTRAVPDGTVEVRITASDRTRNPVATALTGETISAPFDVDNTAPTVQLSPVKVSGGKATVAGTLVDAASAIRDAAYALNSDDWQVVFPADGIFDSPSETLSFDIDDLKPGSYTLVVRAGDMQGNVGVGKTTFEVK